MQRSVYILPTVLLHSIAFGIFFVLYKYFSFVHRILRAAGCLRMVSLATSDVALQCLMQYRLLLIGSQYFLLRRPKSGFDGILAPKEDGDAASLVNG